ncbi:hypothetical protein JXL21_10650 [Candidatus Bathyarchaeota archaeon]|nr:hypothetical protein [Candidatus Bathyarchaeota archaeon]
MTLKIGKKSQTIDEQTLEFLQWLEELKRVRDDFDALLVEYEGKRAKLLDSIKA